MKLRKLKLTITLITPLLFIYLVFSFGLWNLNIAEWGEGRGFYILIILIIYFLIGFLLFIAEYGNKNKFEEWFLYDEVEEMEKKNERIKELNILSKKQLELLKENQKIRNEFIEVRKENQKIRNELIEVRKDVF